MIILTSNDDGVYAPGIKSLNSTLEMEHELWCVAPLEERSTTGHTLSLDNPLRVIKVDDDKNIYGCSGYPADCSLIGFGKIMPYKPNLIVSGINRGANLGQDVYYSGTVAAAREASFHGIPSIAVSLVCDFNETKDQPQFFDTAANFIQKLISEVNLQDIPDKHVLNINVPNLPMKDIKGVKFTSLGFRNYSEEIEERKDFRGRSYYWVGGIYKGFEGDENTDCGAVNSDFISVSLLNLMGKDSDKLDIWHQRINSINF